MRRAAFAVLLLAACAAPPQRDAGARYDSQRFAPFVDDLRAVAARHARELDIPGVWIALLEVDPVTGEQHLWADAVSADGEAPDVLATHRVASISKLFTDTAAMVLVERGALDLDADVRTYLPEFAPTNRWQTPVTLRHLMGHRAGVVRESPVGHYFDPSEPGLRATVASLNDTALITEPGAQYKYSNPGVGVVGEVVARVTGQPFEAALRTLVLEPLRLADSDFAPRADLVTRQAQGIMATYDGRAIPTPNWRFGYVPAAELRSTVVDLVRFARSWFPSATRRVLRADTQAAMWRLPDGARRGCGLGFFVSSLDGNLRVAHGGAVYGFASTLMALPEQGLACAVVCTRDFANDVADAIAERALRHALAQRRGERLPAPSWPEPVGGAAAAALAGRWRCGDNWVRLLRRGDELYYDPNIGVRTRLRRARDGSLVADDALGLGASRRLTFLANGNLHDGAVEYVRDDAPPAPAPAALHDALGEYGWDHNVLVVYEDMGRLAVLIEWFVRDLPDPEGPDLYSFPPGMYHDDLLRFERDGDGRVTAAVVGGARFPRRPGPSAGTFRITPVRPVAELLAEAKRQAPPARLTEGARRPHELVALRELPGGDDLQLELRYASTNNFLGVRVYERAVAKLQRPAAEALLRVHRALAARGLGLKVFDAYRPWHVSKVFWDATPRHQKLFVADPMRGSRHNRGCAVDVTLFDLATGAEVAMPSGYDEFTPRAYPDYPGGTARQRYFREVLRRAMEAEGFVVYEHEWWHFDFGGWRDYAVADEPL